jgi:hypothetical protein
MLETEEKRIELAMVANREEITQYVHDPSTKVIKALLGNRHLKEEDVIIIANRKNVPSDVLETIAKEKRWAESYLVRLALARNPKSPLSISLSIMRYLRLSDLEEIARCHFIPLALRRKVETIIIERIPTLPLGNKKTLAKKAAGNVLLKLLQDSDPDVVQLCLNNPHLVEGHLYKVISRADTVAETIRMIAMHPNWSSRSLIRFSLARNGHTPLSLSVRFLQSMKIMDLRDLYADPSLPVTIKPFVHRELWERGQQPEKAGEEQVYEIDEEEMGELDAEVTRYTTDEQEGESSSREQD